MNEHAQYVFLSEIAKQCNFALNAVVQVNNSLKFASEPPPLGIDERSDLTPIEEHMRRLEEENRRRKYFHNEVFRGLHSFIVHAGIISKLLWPPKPFKKETETNRRQKDRWKRRKSIAAELRRVLEIGNNHPLRSRRLRDHLEHFDDRLYEWNENNKTIFVQDNIGPIDFIAGVPNDVVMRQYDPMTRNFIFQGEGYNIQRLAEAVSDLLEITKNLPDFEYLP
jgi:hypothetical protein